MKTTVRVVRGEARTIALASEIIRRSQWFQIEPLPDGLYAIEVKRENAHLLPHTVGGAFNRN